MYKAFLAIAALSLCTLLSACNASFNNPLTQLADTTKTPKIDSNKLKWYFIESGRPSIEITGIAGCDFGFNITPPQAQVIVAWEAPGSSADPKYYIYNGNMSYLKSNYSFDVIFADSLPKNIIGAYGLSDTAAVGHIFLTSNMTLKNGDSIQASKWFSSGIVGSCPGFFGGGGIDDEAIVFKIGTPVLGGNPLDNNHSKDGFNFLEGMRHDIKDQAFEDDNFRSIPINIVLHITDNPETLKRNFYWLP